MGHYDSENFQQVNYFQMADQRIKLKETQLPLDVSKYCSVFVFSYAEISTLKLS